nr:MAG TPA_asm: hypothetical protein [Bacteriophage sp.]
MVVFFYNLYHFLLLKSVKLFVEICKFAFYFIVYKLL